MSSDILMMYRSQLVSHEKSPLASLECEGAVAICYASCEARKLRKTSCKIPPFL